MRRPRPLLALLGLATLVDACASPNPTHESTPIATAAPHRSAPPTNEPSTTAPSDADPDPAPAPDPAPDPAPPPLPGRDHRSAVSCHADAECGWDDACIPTRCVEASPPQSCDESAPPPGTCACVAGSCTLHPDAPPPPPPEACQLRSCVVDRAAGRCVVDEEEAERRRVGRPVEVGPVCDCSRPPVGCEFHWFDPVPCTTDRDCWISHGPAIHPIARPKALRKRSFRPCVDGEVAPKCGDAGRCVVGPAFKC